MTLLADLLTSGLHPLLPTAHATALAADLTAAAGTLRALVETAGPLRVRVELANKMKTAVAHSLQLSLANLKRAWKTDGKSESDIHAVIPDRPRPRSTAAATPAAAPTTPAGSPPAPVSS